VHNNNLNLRELPSFIEEFNGMFDFIEKITSIIDMIKGTDNSLDDLTLNEILNNQQLLNDIQTRLSLADGKLSEIIAQGDISQNLANQLIEINKEQSKTLDNITGQLNQINAMLNTYLPKITDMLNNITNQNNILSLQIEYLSKQLQEISNKLDIINANVLINATLTEITPSYQRMHYVNEKFDQLSSAHTEKTLRTEQDSDSIDNLNELIEFAQSVTKNDVDSFEFYIETFHDVMVGNNLFGRSAIMSIGEFFKTSDLEVMGSGVANAYNLICVLIALQAKAYATLAACRKMLGLPDVDYSPILEKYVQEEKKQFASSILPELSASFSMVNNIELDEPTDYDDHEFVIQAKPGYALIGFEISDDLDVVAYQAKLNENYEVNAESVSKIPIGNLGFIGYYYYFLQEDDN